MRIHGDWTLPASPCSSTDASSVSSTTSPAPHLSTFCVTKNGLGKNCFVYDPGARASGPSSVCWRQVSVGVKCLCYRRRRSVANPTPQDVLINSLITFSREYFGLKTMVIGGEDVVEDWPVQESEFYVDDAGEMDIEMGPFRRGKLGKGGKVGKQVTRGW